MLHIILGTQLVLWVRYLILQLRVCLPLCIHILRIKKLPYKSATPMFFRSNIASQVPVVDALSCSTTQLLDVILIVGVDSIFDILHPYLN